VAYLGESAGRLKLPLQQKQIGQAIAEVNAGRDVDDRVLVSIDGVHGFGVENINLEDLGIDFFSAGCHKWLFGLRGTGILWANDRAWAASRPLIPIFVDDGVWAAWLNGEDQEGPTTAKSDDSRRVQSFRASGGDGGGI
jgi:isopenicillin-N epimerase